MELPIDFQDVVCVDQADGTTLHTDIARLYLIRLAGVRVAGGTHKRAPAQVYAFSVEDLGRVIARLVIAAANNGDGAVLCDTLMQALELDPEALKAAAAAMDVYRRQN